MDYTQELFTSRSNYADGNKRIGQVGRLWYDSITNTLRVGTGRPGGKIVGSVAENVPDFLITPPEESGQVLSYANGAWSNIPISQLVSAQTLKKVELMLSGIDYNAGFDQHGMTEIISYRAVFESTNEPVSLAAVVENNLITISSTVDLTGVVLTITGY